MRSTREVVEDHLRLAAEGRLEDDLRANYDPEVVLLSAEGVHHGHDGARLLADVLERHLPAATFTIRHLFVWDRHALELWSGRGGGRHVRDGADSFVVQDGLIVAQTISFLVDDDG